MIVWRLPAVCPRAGPRRPSDAERNEIPRGHWNWFLAGGSARCRESEARGVATLDHGHNFLYVYLRKCEEDALYSPNRFSSEWSRFTFKRRRKQVRRKDGISDGTVAVG